VIKSIGTHCKATVFEQFIMSEPCRSAACEMLEKWPFIATIVGSSVVGLIGLRILFKRSESKSTNVG
jgi:hypothetical protein